METTVPIAIAAAAVFLLALGAVADDRRARVRRRIAAEPAWEPPLLHSINDDRCIGCEACVDACPTEVLELLHHKARVVRFSDCVQCEQCANACPTTALVMYRDGTVPQTLTVAELDEHFQTGVPGQYLIGEVAGKPLVKNAANLGRAVIEHVTRTLGTPASPGVLDVVIVGSGPGGLSAGLTCIRNKLSCVVLEKEHVIASTVARYPKGKLFMAEPSNAGNVSYLPVFDAMKEELVAAWQRVVEGAKLPVKLGEAVESVKRGDDGVFTIKTTVATYQARAVVLATGLRGKPRLLAVPGANLEKVKSRLDDPDELAGRHVLVVGGGDSAVEGAMSLAEVGATVTLSYRGDGFKRCKQANQKRLAEMAAANALTVLLESNVQEFTDDTVTIQLKDKSVRTIANHAAFVLIGADTPVAWLEANNVRFVEREHLYALGSTEDVVRAAVPEAIECPKSVDDALAIVLGKAAPRASHNRLRSVVEHIHDEFRDVLTSVTGVFRLTDDDVKPVTRTGAKRYQTQVGPAPKRPVPPPKRPAPPKLIPTSNLKPRQAPPPVPPGRPAVNPFEPEHTVKLSAYGRPAPRPTGKPVPAPSHDTTPDDMLSLPARLVAQQLGQALGARARQNPFDGDPTTIETSNLRDSSIVTGDSMVTVVTPETGETVALRRNATAETVALPRSADKTVETPAVPPPRRASSVSRGPVRDGSPVQRTAPPRRPTTFGGPSGSMLAERQPRPGTQFPPEPTIRAYDQTRQARPARFPRGTGSPTGKTD
jgi:thioredoxin reductase/ferredoxin